MKTLIVLIAAILIAGPAFSKDKVYADAIIINEVTSIYDADTFRVDIDKWPSIIGEHIPVRVLGIDAPEIRGKCEQEKLKARSAKQFTVEHLRNAKVIELRNIQRGKYFRLLADVYVDNKSLSDLLIKSGHAREYDGGTRQGWCP